jgi:hypothetical protein
MGTLTLKMIVVLEITSNLDNNNVNRENEYGNIS